MLQVTRDELVTELRAHSRQAAGKPISSSKYRWVCSELLGIQTYFAKPMWFSDQNSLNHRLHEADKVIHSKAADCSS